MNRLRRLICEKLPQFTKYELEVPRTLTQPALQLTLTYNNVEDGAKILQILKQTKYEDSFVEDVHILATNHKSQLKFEFKLQRQAFVEAALQHDNILPITLPAPQSVALDFSSPNIAKPFHVGHLRSTIIGNVLSNLHQHLGYKVTKINYLGDWGTQFGLLQVGVDHLGITDEQMQQKPIETLYKAYVAANSLATSDAAIMDKARKYFKQLEEGTNVELAKQWQKYRVYTIAELEKMYARLGVHFDTYEWESQYSQQQISKVLSDLEAKSLLHEEADGRKVLIVNERRIPVVKSDGSTLYLTRDIAAILERWQRLKFQHIYYVVENAQSDHFKALFKTTADLCEELKLVNMQHVKFGRIHGMSTRSGNVVFLSDVLDEARSIMLEKQLKSATTKINLNDKTAHVADVLGVTAVIVNDLKQRRQRDYDFSWTKALQVNGDTGIKLQYTHCRLYSLLQQFDNVHVDDIKPNVQHLLEPEAQDLLSQLLRFQQTLYLTQRELEACVLVNYLFALW